MVDVNARNSYHDSKEKSEKFMLGCATHKRSQNGPKLFFFIQFWLLNDFLVYVNHKVNSKNKARESAKKQYE